MNSYEDFHLTWNSRPNLSLSITLRHSMIKALSVKYTCSEEDNVHWCQKWSLSFLSEWCKGKEVKATKTRPFWEGACSPRAHSIHQRSQPKELQRLLIEDLYFGTSWNLREGKRDDKETKIFKNLYKGKNKTLEWRSLANCDSLSRGNYLPCECVCVFLIRQTGLIFEHERNLKNKSRKQREK